MTEAPSGRDLAAALAAATTSRGLYPAGHPRCQAALDLLAGNLDAVFASGRPEVTLLVVDGELVIDGEALRGATLHGHGLLRSLARLGIERLTLSRGLERDELEALLAALAGEQRATGSPHVVLGHVFVGAGGETAAPGEAAAEQSGCGAGSGAGFGTAHFDALTGGLDLLRSDLLNGFAQLDRALWQVVEATARESRPLVVLGEMRSADERLHRHAVAVSTWSLAFARGLGFPEESLHDLALAGLLHDVGLLSLPAELVFARGTRGDAERRELRRHPWLGALRLCAIPDVGAIPILVAHEHHVWHDGRGGYPALGRPPHLAARLVAVVDTWDMFHAATAGHPPAERRAWSAKALASRAGTWLDPELVRLFLDWLAVGQ